jgi:hypothetical protein
MRVFKEKGESIFLSFYGLLWDRGILICVALEKRILVAYFGRK